MSVVGYPPETVVELTVPGQAVAGLPPVKLGAEAEIGLAVAAYLRDQHWTVYQEVAFHDADGIADIVATQAGRVAVVELKTSFSLEVIAQARRWLPFAHWSWIAVPKAKARKVRDGRWLGERLCEDLGIGVLEVQPIHDGNRRMLACPPGESAEWGFDAATFHAGRTRAVAAPRLQRRAETGKLLAELKPEHQNYAAAGAQHARHWSPFQATCRDVRRVP